MPPKTVHECQICHKKKSVSQMMPSEMVRDSIAEMIERDHPEWSHEGFICQQDLNRYRAQHVEEMLAAERGELSQLELDVVLSLKEQDLLAENLEDNFAEKSTPGQRLADKIASFGGSWSFLISFGTILLIWIVCNTALLASRPFDPYPFILLNLVLSCIAAVQAPVIMMSQNRQEAKDRIRADNDYRINLKSEVEIRQLHSKMDMLLTHQWQRLLEIQQLQIDLMEQIANKR